MVEVGGPAARGNPVFHPSPEMVVQDLTGETLVYHRERSRLYVLNTSAAAILRLCDGERPEAEIVRQLGENFRAVGAADLTGDVHRTLTELIDLGIVSWA